MKSKFIFLLLLFSLFLNISHDLILANKADKGCCQTVQWNNSSSITSVCLNMVDLHEAFHFSAILTSLIALGFALDFHENLIFISLTPPSLMSQSSFKPPIV